MLDRLTATIDELFKLDPDVLSDAELNRLQLELHQVRARLDAARARLTGAWDARRAWFEDNTASGAAWLRTRCQVEAATASRQIRVARALRHMPVTAAAWAAGTIGADQVRLLVRANNRRVTEAFARDEALLVAKAQDPDLFFADFSRAIGYWLVLNDADGTERTAVEQHGRRRAHLSQSFGGWWYGEFGLDAVNGTIVANTLEAIEQDLFTADVADARARLGAAATLTAADLARTPEQRRADALVEMAVRARTAPAGGRRPAPLFTVLLGYETFAGMLCELEDGAVLPPGVLAGYLSDAVIERIVFDGPSRVIDIGEQRLFTGALRRAIQVRDRTCFEHCDVPARRCHVDHKVRYADGGRTIEINGQLACEFHNLQRERRRPRRRPPPDDG